MGKLYEEIFNGEVAPFVQPVVPVTGAKHQPVAELINETDSSANKEIAEVIYSGREILTALMFLYNGDNAYSGGETITIKAQKQDVDLVTVTATAPSLSDGGFAVVPVKTNVEQYTDTLDLSATISLPAGGKLNIFAIFETADSKALADAAVKSTIVTSAEPEIEVKDNAIFNCGVLDSIEITAPAAFGLDFACQLNFTSGDTPTAFSSDGVTYAGDNTSDGVFTPIADRRYTIMFYSNGTDLVGAVKGVAA